MSLGRGDATTALGSDGSARGNGGRDVRWGAWVNRVVRSARESAVHQVRETFLPSGYPASVAPRYARYVWLQAVHHGAGAANGVLASTFLLYSVGLGSGAIATAGALSWALKDGLGQLGTLLFARAMAHNFDVYSRGWYLTASALLNSAVA